MVHKQLTRGGGPMWVRVVVVPAAVVAGGHPAPDVEHEQLVGWLVADDLRAVAPDGQRDVAQGEGPRRAGGGRLTPAPL